MRGATIQIEINNNKTHFILLSVLDNVLSAVVVAPAVIGYWRGTWNMADFYLFRGNEEISMLSSLIFGFVGQIIFTYSQDYLARKLSINKNRIVFYIVSRTYTYIFGAVCVHLWRGIWKALEIYTGYDTVKLTISAVLSICFLVASRVLRNISSSPFFLAVDSAEGYFSVPTMFKLTGSKSETLFVLDSFFGIFIVGTLVVFAWRGVWSLFDIYLFPGQERLSASFSLMIGYAIVFIAFITQNMIKKWCKNLSGLWRLVVWDICMLSSFVGTINVWRGIWNYLNLYLLPESPVLSFWITHFGCFAFLVLMNCSNTVLVRGVYVDGEDEEGNLEIFPIFYLRKFFPGNKKEDESQLPKTGITVEGA